MRFEDLTGRTVAIWGAGREGRAAYADLTARGVTATIAVTGTDAVPDDLRDVAVAGSAALERLKGADVVVKSPGVPHTAPEFLRLRELGTAITSLTDLWLNDNHGRVIGVTGTKGKSTTSALIHHVLGGVGITSSLVGNGGTPVTADDRAGAQVAVAEVSSYQAAELSASPRVAVVTSLYPEHLPWHGSYEQYVADKLNLVAHGPEVVVVPELAGGLAELVAARVGSATRMVDPGSVGLTASETGIVWDGAGELAAGDVVVRGRHNLVNLALALTAATLWTDLGVDDRHRLLEAARTFAPLAHRLERVPSGDGRAWIDDGLATAPEAVVAALDTFPDARVTLIVGGADRGLAFAPLVEHLARRAAQSPVDVIAVGPAGARLVDEAGDLLGSDRLAPSFAAALRHAADNPAGTDVVLLSPGAPSFDEFASYEERAAAFRAAAAASTPEAG